MLHAASCSVVIERKNRTHPSFPLINLAEVRLLNRAGTPIPAAGLIPWISSMLPGFPVQNCFDGDNGTFCHTNDGNLDPDPMLKVSYPCSEEVNTVEVVNRQQLCSGCQDRITAFQLRLVNSTGASLSDAYPFDTAQPSYTIRLQGECLASWLQTVNLVDKATCRGLIIMQLPTGAAPVACLQMTTGSHYHCRRKCTVF